MLCLLLKLFAAVLTNSFAIIAESLNNTAIKHLNKYMDIFFFSDGNITIAATNCGRLAGKEIVCGARDRLSDTLPSK